MSDLSTIFADLENLSDLAPAKPATSTFEATETDDAGLARIEGHDAIRKFCLAGDATFTLRSTKTGTRFTYHIGTSEDGNMAFVKLLTGPDNYANYSYFANIKVSSLSYWHGKKARISADAPGVVAFTWFWNQLQRHRDMVGLEFWHAGKCARCGLKLTDPESISSGYGPVCIGKMEG